MTAPGDRLFSLLLRLYPREFRERFGPEMFDLFHARRQMAARSRLARLRFWAALIIDTVRAALRERFPSNPALANTPERRSTPTSGLGYDVRQAWRMLTRAPLVSTFVVMLIALGLGSTTALFAVVDAVLLRPFPFANPDRLVMVWERRTGTNPRNVVGAHEFAEWRTAARSFDRMAAMVFDRDFALSGDGDALSLVGARVTSDFFPVMGVEPIAGRAFGADADQPGSPPVAVISERLWRDRFGADPALIGRSIRINDGPVTVLGVMPASFRFPPDPTGAAPDVWTPIAEPFHLYRGRHYMFVVARLKDGVTIRQAQVEMDAITGRIATVLPQFSKGHGANVLPLHGELVQGVQRSLLMLFAGVALVLLIACCNVAILLLSRAAARQQEMAVRIALGAGRLRIARQVLVEGAMLALVGGVSGTLIAAWLVTFASKAVGADVPRIEAAHIDLRVAAFAAAASLLTAVMFGLGPVAQLWRVPVSDRLKNGAKGIARADRQRLRRALVIGEIALTVTIAAGAALFLQSFYRLIRVQPGFNPSGVLAADVAIPGSRYATAAAQRAFYADAVARVAALPDVRAAAATNMIPQGSGSSGIAVRIEGRPAPPPGQELSAAYRVVTPDYFRALGIPVVRGRVFTAQDARVAVPLIRWFPQQPLPARFDAPQPAPVAIVNESMARAFWPGDHAVGRRFTVLFSPPITVVGIVRDTRNRALSEAPQPEFYLSSDQEPQSRMTLLVAANGNPPALPSGIRGVLRTIDAGVPAGRVRPFAEIIDANLALHRSVTLLLGGFALAALLLMTLGVYAVVSYAATQRAYEIGVRVALGAQRHDIRRLIVVNGAALALAGIALGLGGAYALGRFVANVLYEVTPNDPGTYIALTALVLTIATLASWLPARRAQRVDPVTVLRNE